ncbi:MAG TPA: His-Xaa-Ser system radical SAM maturase HxsC [Solirubrobacterales bacterium]|nr:His-Xaa-Ser system radical SAM maturase HxsC [Solirubrobacterales bacterium]
MIALRGRSAAFGLDAPLSRAVWLLVDRETLTPQRHGRAYLVRNGEEPPDEFGLYLVADPKHAPASRPWIALSPLLRHLSAGDVVSASATGEYVRVLWRRASPANSVLLTERCDHYCLMCSQPPKEREDDWLLENARELIRLLPPSTPGIGFTGGEPTIYGERLLELLRLCGNLLPDADVHVLSNGRRFADFGFASAWAGVGNPRMMVGIPIYGAEPTLHDYVVQAEGAFDETVRGIVNLGEAGARTEIRVVIHKQTAPALPEIAEFIARNLSFVEQVALMGLEMIGFARANMDEVWIDPVDYQAELTEAVSLLARRGVRTMIYNHQLCLLDRKLWPFAVRSISDWKNEYHPECAKCAELDRCGGFFFSAKYRHSDHIKAIEPDGTSPRRQVLAVSDPVNEG